MCMGRKMGDGDGCCWIEPLDCACLQVPPKNNYERQINQFTLTAYYLYQLCLHFFVTILRETRIGPLKK